MKDILKDHLDQYVQQQALVQGAIQALQNLAKALEDAEASEETDS